MPELRLVPLSVGNFADFERLTARGEHGGCYCAFWHQKFSSIEEWQKREREAPEKNRACMLQRVESQFHVGVLAYEDDRLLAWISVSPLAEVYWAWRRVAAVGDAARTTACIPCFVVEPAARGQGIQARVLRELRGYGASRGWSAIEGYPFDDAAVAKDGAKLHWPGRVRGFEQAGFARVGAHWLSTPELPRSIYRQELA